MSEQSPSKKPSATDQILDLLLDALLERQATRKTEDKPRLEEAAKPSPPEREPEPEPIKPLPSTTKPAEPAAKAKTETPPTAPRPAGEKAPPEPEPGDEGWTPPPRQPSINLGQTLGRLFVGLAVLAVLINIPINRYGTSLARIMPDTASLVIRDGLVVKGSGEEIYVLEDNKLRWISSLEAFEYFGYQWEDVHLVDDELIEEFEKGAPIYVLLKCNGSPHIYALEKNQKRWIKDIPTFEAQGYVWDDVMIVDCYYLRNLPDGPTIPEDAGTPPQP
jgi:hypothetical protein